MRIPSPTDCPYFLVSRASLAVTSALKQALTEAGVKHVRPAYLGVLMSLWNEDGLKVVELGRRAGLEPSTMTGLIDRMEADELVQRMDDPDDRRAHRIHLTHAGIKAKEPVLEVVDSTLNKALKGIGEKDLIHMKKILRRVLQNAREEDQA